MSLELLMLKWSSELVVQRWLSELLLYQDGHQRRLPELGVGRRSWRTMMVRACRWSVVAAVADDGR